MQATPMRIPVTRAALIMMIVATPLFGQIETRTGRAQFALPPTVAAALAGPIITALGDSSGGPRHQLWIMGSGFGAVTADTYTGRTQQVHFVMNGQDVMAQVNGYWTDTKILVLVPTIPYATSGRADIYVVTASGAKSASQPYSYVGPIITVADGGTAGSYIDIRGSGFGEPQAGDGGVREVHFVMNGQDLKAPTINFWHDNQIRPMVPTFPMVIVPGRAEVYVVTAWGAKTAPQPFLYTPVYGTRVYCLESFPPGTTIIKPGSLQAATVWPASVADPGCAPKGAVLHRNIGLAGAAGNDWFFMGVRLTNGWVVENVILGVYNAQQAGAVIASSGKGSNNVVTNVRWWADVGSWVGVTYTLAVVIRGPVELPDGWLVR